MKEIMAVVRGPKTSATKDALTEAGFAGFSSVACLGRGRELVNPAILKLLMESGNDELVATGKSLTDPTRLIPKRLFSIVVEDDQVEHVVKTLMAANASGQPGDGKIFILPVLESYRVSDSSACDSGA